MNLKQKLIAGASVLALTFSAVPAAFATGNWNNNNWQNDWTKSEWKNVKHVLRNEWKDWRPVPQNLTQQNILVINKLKIKQKGNNNTVSWVFVNR